MSEDTNKQGTAALETILRDYESRYSNTIALLPLDKQKIFYAAKDELAALVAAPALAVRDALEMAAKECDRHAEFCKREWENGGDFEHLKVRHDEALYNAQRIRALAPAEVIRAGEAHDAAIRDEAIRGYSAALASGPDAVKKWCDEYLTARSASVKPPTSKLYTESEVAVIRDEARFAAYKHAHEVVKSIHVLCNNKGPEWNEGYAVGINNAAKTLEMIESQPLRSASVKPVVQELEGK